MSNKTPYVARVERVFLTGAGRHVRIVCPFLCGQRTHEHPWPSGHPHPSQEVLAHCAGQDELLTYAIDARSAAANRRAVANAGHKGRSQIKSQKS